MNDLFLTVTWKQTPLPKTALARAASESCAAPALHAITVLDETTRYVIGTSKDNETSHWQQHDYDIFLHGQLCGGFRPAQLNLEQDLSQTLLSYVPDGLYNLLFWNRTAQTLFVLPDAIGARPLYYWQDGSTLVLSSTLKAFRHLPQFTFKLSTRVLAETLVLRHPLSSATLLDGVQMLPRDSAVRFSASGVDVFPRNAVTLRDPVPMNTALRETLDGTMATSVQSWLQGVEQFALSLSGGLDSRLALGHARRLEADVLAMTWGEPSSDDFRFGQMLAAAAGARHLNYPLSHELQTNAPDLAFPARHVESFSISGVPFYWRGWIELLQAQARPVAHGFLGSFLGGGSFGVWGLAKSTLESNASKVIPSLAGQILSPSSTLLEFATPSFKQELTHGNAETLTREFLTLPGELMYQRLRYFELYYRQRRYLAHGIPKLMYTFMPVILPFYTQRNLEFFLNLPFAALWGRPLLRDTLSHYFPELSSVPEADTGNLPVKRSFADKLVIGARGYAQKLIPALKPKPSSSIFASLFRSHLPMLTATLRESHDFFAPYLDLQGLATHLETDKRKVNRGTMMTLFNLCIFTQTMLASDASPSETTQTSSKQFRP